MPNQTSFPISRPRAVAGLLAALAACLAAALLACPPAGAISTAPHSPTGHWKLFVSIDFESEGTFTYSGCEQPSTGGATQRISVRTVRPGTIETHVAPNGVGVVQEDTYAPAMRTRITATGTGEFAAGGTYPPGCFPTTKPEPPPRPCRPESVLSGVYVSPLGPIGHLRGFTVGQEESPWEGEGGCPVTLAQEKLGHDLTLEVEVSKRKLLSHGIPKLVFHKTRRFEANAREEGFASSATASLTYTVKLVRTRMPVP